MIRTVCARACALGLAALAAGPAAARAQTAEGGIAGVVIDAVSRSPIAGATLTLEPRDAGVFRPGRETGAFLRSGRSTDTNERGEYRFADVPEGEYRLLVQRVGYQSATADVSFRGTTGSRVSFGLTVAPVALQPIEIGAVAATPALPNAARLDNNRVDQKRIAAERARQNAYAASDVRVVTRADVSDGITLGETDLFRAMQRLPGVSTADEYSAELWTRGAHWDHTRVYFDGLPLFNPLHAAGVFSGVNADGVSAALMHPGLQPTNLSGGAAAAIELHSRQAELHPDYRYVGELSLVSARITAQWRSDSSRTSALVSLRRTYLDWLTRAIERVSNADDVHVPYRFWDTLIRLDHDFGNGRRVEFSNLIELDELRGDVPDVLQQTRADWGGGATRLTYETPLLGLRTRHTIGLSGFGSSIERVSSDVSSSGFNADVGRPARSDLWYVTLFGDVQNDAATWFAGYEFVTQRANYDGPQPGPYHPLATWQNSLHLRPTATHGALWAERRWTPADAWTVQTGLRIEAGEALDGSPVRIAPRVAARYRMDARTSFSAAIARHHQYTQGIAGVGIRPTKGLHAEYIWMPAGADMPVLHADVATLGVERWIGNDWLAGVTLHARRANGVNTPDPSPGNTLDNPLFVMGRNTAHGIDISARRLAGRVTGSLAYSYGKSMMTANGFRFAAPGDRRHVFDATAQMRLGSRWLLGAAYTAASGAPYTRSFLGTITCDTNGANCDWYEEPWQAAPATFRTRSFQGLDLLAEWSHTFNGWQGGVFLQVRNALNRSNQGRYAGFAAICTAACTGIPRSEFGNDEFLPGAPMLPVIGFRFAF